MHTAHICPTATEKRTVQTEKKGHAGVISAAGMQTVWKKHVNVFK